MKYFSEITNQPYDTIEELEVEEAKAKARELIETYSEKECSTENSHDCAISADEEIQVFEKPSRKQLAAEVEVADDKLREANANLEVANTQVEELYQRYLKEAEEIIGPAKRAVQEAHRARYLAIERFNKEYGAYQVTYTGARAADEVLKAMNDLARTTNMFRSMFWF
jgi:DNA repair exonuclease SbcCD ATPase subunit